MEEWGLFYSLGCDGWRCIPLVLGSVPHLSFCIMVLLTMMACVCFPIVGFAWFIFLLGWGALVLVVEGGGLCGNSNGA